MDTFGSFEWCIKHAGQSVAKSEPLCPECNDTGLGKERDDGGQPSCWGCAKGSALDYEAEKDYGRLPFLEGTLTQYLDRMVKDYGRVDNREVA